MAHTHPNSNLFGFLAMLFAPQAAVVDPILPAVEEWTEEDEMHYQALEARHRELYAEEYAAEANRHYAEDHTRFPNPWSLTGNS